MDEACRIAQLRSKTVYLNKIAKITVLDEKCVLINAIESGSLNNVDLALGAKYATCEEVSCAITSACPKPPRTQGNGSACFSGTPNTYLLLPYDHDFAIGTDDFTLEWFQYMLAGPHSPRIFSVGSFPMAEFAFTIENCNLFLWVGGCLFYFGQAETVNRWAHFAIVRKNGIVTIFVDGIALPSISIPHNFTTTLPLIIGNEHPSYYSPESTCFKGYITNFAYDKAYAKYTANFTPETLPILPNTATRLLLWMLNNNVTTDYSGWEKTVQNNGVAWAPLTPFSPFV